MNHGIFRANGVSHVTQATITPAPRTPAMPLRDRVLAVIGDSRRPVHMGYFLAILRGVTEEEVSAELDHLTQEGLLKRTGTARAYDYQLTQAGRHAYRALKRPDRQESPPP